jgi:hypothetical protein
MLPNFQFPALNSTETAARLNNSYQNYDKNDDYEDSRYKDAWLESFVATLVEDALADGAL